MSHTPAPWWVADYGVRDRGGFICARIAVQRYEGQDERFAREVAEHDANARLIAAAPDLLEALRDMLNTLTDGPDESDVARVFGVSRAAIAKATGETA
jgi:hypothetical protein